MMNQCIIIWKKNLVADSFVGTRSHGIEMWHGEWQLNSFVNYCLTPTYTTYS